GGELEMPPANDVGGFAQVRGPLLRVGVAPGGERLLRRRNRLTGMLHRGPGAVADDFARARRVDRRERRRRADAPAADDQGVGAAELALDRLQAAEHLLAVLLAAEVGQRLVLERRGRRGAGGGGRGGSIHGGRLLGGYDSCAPGGWSSDAAAIRQPF